MKIVLTLLVLGIVLVQNTNSQLRLPKPGQTLSTLTKPVTNTIQLFTQQFSEFKNKFHKTYASKEEEEKRLNIFSTNNLKVADLKKVTDLPFVVKLNEFCDLVSSEFNKLLNGLKIRPEKRRKPVVGYAPTKEKLVDNFDWRDKGVVSEIKNQGQCASCYAFASSAAIESHIAIKKKEKVDLSPQDIVDCSLETPYENFGCDGGSLEPAYDFVKDKGVVSSSSYPYTAETGGNCIRQDDKIVANINGYVTIPEGDDEALKEALVKHGPIGVGIDASAETFQFYGGGIYYEKECHSDLDHINHAVLLVGYGEEADGQKYWIIKNSYGPSWGEDGYAKIARNVTNHCGISSYALFPKVG